MGNEKSAGKKGVKPVIIAIVAVLAAVAIFFLASSLMGDSDAESGKEPVQGTVEQTDESTSSTKESATSTTTSAVIDDIADSPVADQNSNDADVSTTTGIVTTTAKKDETVLSANTKSEILKGATAVRRWEASSVISNVVAEKVKVSLPVYEDGVKTSSSKDAYLYIAEIETRPSRVSVVAASQFTSAKVADMSNFVKGLENVTNQDVLFASTNEMCARDFDNPTKNVFYNGDDSLTATVIKNGVIAQRGDASKNSLVIYKDGKWEYPVSVSMSSADKLIKNGAIASVSYTYPVIWEGKKYNHPDAGVNTVIWTNHSIDKATNNTLIGKVGNDKYYVLVSEGFGSGYLAEYMLNDLGVEYAYWGNGGVSAAMYVKGYGVITPNDYVVHGDLFCVR